MVLCLFPVVVELGNRRKVVPTISLQVPGVMVPSAVVKTLRWAVMWSGCLTTVPMMRLVVLLGESIGMPLQTPAGLTTPAWISGTPTAAKVTPPLENLDRV